MADLRAKQPGSSLVAAATRSSRLICCRKARQGHMGCSNSDVIQTPPGCKIEFHKGAPLMVDLDLVDSRRASDGDLFSRRLGKSKSPARRAASSKAVGKAAAAIPDSPSAPLLRAPLDELNFARRASIPVLSAEDLRKITPRFH
eukprot:s592_g16.t1